MNGLSVSFYKLLSAINAGVWGTGFFLQVGPVVHLALVFAIVLLIVDHIERRGRTKPTRNSDSPIDPERRCHDRGEHVHTVKSWSNSTGFPTNLSPQGRVHVIRHRPLNGGTSSGLRATRL